MVVLKNLGVVKEKKRGAGAAGLKAKSLQIADKINGSKSNVKVSDKSGKSKSNDKVSEKVSSSGKVNSKVQKSNDKSSDHSGKIVSNHNGKKSASAGKSGNKNGKSRSSSPSSSSSSSSSSKNAHEPSSSSSSSSSRSSTNHKKSLQAGRSATTKNPTSKPASKKKAGTKKKSSTNALIDAMWEKEQAEMGEVDDSWILNGEEIDLCNTPDRPIPVMKKRKKDGDGLDEGKKKGGEQNSNAVQDIATGALVGGNSGGSSFGSFGGGFGPGFGGGKGGGAFGSLGILSSPQRMKNGTKSNAKTPANGKLSSAIFASPPPSNRRNAFASPGLRNASSNGSKNLIGKNANNIAGGGSASGSASTNLLLSKTADGRAKEQKDIDAASQSKSLNLLIERSARTGSKAGSAFGSLGGGSAFGNLQLGNQLQSSTGLLGVGKSTKASPLAKRGGTGELKHLHWQSEMETVLLNEMYVRNRNNAYQS
jgi:hypothetical protein